VFFPRVVAKQQSQLEREKHGRRRVDAAGEEKHGRRALRQMSCGCGVSALPRPAPRPARMRGPCSAHAIPRSSRYLLGRAAGSRAAGNMITASRTAVASCPALGRARALHANLPPPATGTQAQRGPCARGPARGGCIAASARGTPGGSRIPSLSLGAPDTNGDCCRMCR
jgi:hypothetical protein